MGKLTKSSIDKEFRIRCAACSAGHPARPMLEKVTPDKAVDAMSKYGTVLRAPLVKADELNSGIAAW
jgi:hypothetical protein